MSTGFVPQTGQIGTALCDATARFETANLAPTRPTWINYTGGDTLHSVAVTDQAVYVQGHQRWLDNPQGRDSAGPGAVSRPGIGAINPTTGLALSWNPTKDRGVGGKDLLVTARGLWVAQRHRAHRPRDADAGRAASGSVSRRPVRAQDQACTGSLLCMCSMYSLVIRRSTSCRSRLVES